MKIRKALAVILGLSMLGAECAVSSADEVYEINIDTAAQQTVKGWGVYPNSIGGDFLDRTLAHEAIYSELGITQFRVELRGQAGDADGNIVQDVYKYFVENIRLGVNNGIKTYSVHIWSPPPGMKTNNSISGKNSDGSEARLLESKEQLFCDWVVKCFDGLKSNNLPLPAAFSFQNEPDVIMEYQSCGYDADQYIRVAKLMRRTLDAAGYSDITIIGPEAGTYWNAQRWLGYDNFSNLANDEEFNNAIGAFATHSYQYKAGNPDSHMQTYKAACDAFPEKERWQTEFCNGNTGGDNQTLKTIAAVSTMNADMEWGGANYWCWWLAFDAQNRYSMDEYYQEILLAGDGKTTLERSKQFYALKTIYNSVPVGSVVKRVTTTDTSAKIQVGLMNDFAAYENGSESVVVMVNGSDTEKSYIINGLKGNTAELKTISEEADGVQNAARISIASGRSDTVTLKPQTVNVLITENTELTKPENVNIVTDNSSARLSWEAPENGNPAGYYIYRNGARIAEVNGTEYTDEGLEPGTEYTYKLSAYGGSLESYSADIAVTTGQTAGDSAPEAVSISPREYEVCTLGDTHYINAQVLSSLSDLASVQYYCNGKLIGSASNAAYAPAWKPETAGKYSIAVKLTDTDGNTSYKEYSVYAAENTGLVSQIYHDRCINYGIKGVNYNSNAYSAEAGKVGQGKYSLKIKALAGKDSVDLHTISNVGGMAPACGISNVQLEFYIYIDTASDSVMNNSCISLIMSKDSASYAELRLPLTDYISVSDKKKLIRLTIPYTDFLENGEYYLWSINPYQTTGTAEYDDIKALDTIVGMGFHTVTAGEAETPVFIDDVKLRTRDYTGTFVIDKYTADENGAEAQISAADHAVVQIWSESGRDAAVITGIYEDGRLCGVYSEEPVLKPGMNRCDVCGFDKAFGAECAARIFVWDSAQGMLPLN